jgi:hypothetical protein
MSCPLPVIDLLYHTETAPHPPRCARRPLPAARCEVFQVRVSITILLARRCQRAERSLFVRLVGVRIVVIIAG